MMNIIAAAVLWAILAILAILIIISSITAYKLGEVDGEIKQIRREKKFINEINPMDPDAAGMIHAMERLQELREEDKKK